MNKLVFGFWFLVFGLMIGFVGGASVDKDVLDSFGKGDVVPVIVEKSVSFGKGFRAASFDDGHRERIGMRVSEEELDRLLLDSRIDEVRMNYPLEIFLQDSVGIVEANSSWELSYDGFNMTGSGQSVCILDTGINNSHPDVSGKILVEKCFCTVSDSGGGGCCPDGTGEDESAVDDHGHGAHVAGIVAASNGISGVAVDTSLVIVKIMNASGEGWLADLESGIEWCVNNSGVYNISVISASLGDSSTGYSSSTQSSCDERSSVLTGLIDDAFDENISVVFATGNEARSNGISWPSCISSAVPVGAVDKNDDLASYGNRGDLLLLLGVGGGVSETSQINSTSYSGGYEFMHGTSMATPMVSASIAILNQFLSLSSRSLTPSGIEDVLYNSGKKISESGSNYSRINIYDALLSFDPDVSLVSPVDDYINASSNYTFSCNYSDLQLSNVTFKIWNSSGLYYNLSLNVSGSLNSSSFNLTGIPENTYFWNCFVEDESGNLGFGISNFTLFVDDIEVNLNSPDNDSYTNVNLTEFNCTARSVSVYELSNVTLEVWDSSGILVWNETRYVSGIENSSLFNYTFLEDGDFEWGCVAFNNNSDGVVSSNYSVHYDSAEPVISSVEASSTTGSVTIAWVTNESANSSLNFNGGSWSNSSSYVVNHSTLVSGLSASTNYDYVLRSCDRAGNCGNFSGSVTTGAVAVTPSGGGGGGGGSSVKNVNVIASEFWDGKAESLKKNDRVNFNLASGSHSLELLEVGGDFVRIVVSSDPIFLNLSVGEEVLLNLSNSEFYDFLVRLDKVENGKADVFVRRIFEVIDDEVPEAAPGKNDTDESDEGRVFHATDEEGFNWEWIVAGFLGLVFLGWFLFGERHKARRHLKREVGKHLKGVHGVHKVLKREARKEKKIKRSVARKKNGKG